MRKIALMFISPLYFFTASANAQICPERSLLEHGSYRLSAAACFGYLQAAMKLNTSLGVPPSYNEYEKLLRVAEGADQKCGINYHPSKSSSEALATAETRAISAFALGPKSEQASAMNAIRKCSLILQSMDLGIRFPDPY
jgi:hypothetical protein